MKAKGHYGIYGGQYVAETLMGPLAGRPSRIAGVSRRILAARRFSSSGRT